MNGAAQREKEERRGEPANPKRTRPLTGVVPVVFVVAIVTPVVASFAA